MAEKVFLKPDGAGVKGKIDLHMHTTVSDGTDTPEQILRNVKDAGIGLFSVTDHDAVKGGRIIKDLLKKGDPEFITGVEFSCRDSLGSYHILGYGYDPDSDPVRRLVEEGHGYRMKKLGARLDFLESEYGVRFSGQDVEKLYSLDNPGKPHIANLMVKYGYAETKEQAIKEYLDRMRSASEYVRPEEAIEGITEGGGIPVLAHPSYGNGDQLITGDDMEKRIRRLAGAGLSGLEAFYSGFTSKLTAEILSYAERFGMYVTAGSDYHGKNKMIRLGDTGFSPSDAAPAGMARFLSDVKRLTV